MALNQVTGLWLALFLFVLFSVGGNFFRSADAEQEQNGIGRYQVSAWGAYSGERVHHSGYYVVDTVTGKIVDRGHSTHSIEGPVAPRK
jgi:hypothetical protein